jgi:NAD(P)-dependent dehydrogenase (short-subunit alcohol dehydrogenase family)
VTRKVAFVTGASRGIGRAASVALAEVGYDVVVTARTLREGEGVARGASFRDPRAVPVAGSLESTAAAIEKLGRAALPLRLDLMDRESIRTAVERALAQWGQIDLLLNNGIYQGPGLMDRFLDFPLDAMELIFAGNVFNQTYLTRLVLPHMLARGGGIVVNMTSGSGQVDPPGPVGEGGWGFAYAASKAAFHRMAGILHVEHARDGIRAYNIDPGYTPTESQRALHGADTDLDRHWGGAPPEVAGKVVGWIASDPGAREWDGKLILSQRLCRKLGLLPGWPPPGAEA